MVALLLLPRFYELYFLYMVISTFILVGSNLVRPIRKSQLKYAIYKPILRVHLLTIIYIKVSILDKPK